MSTPVRVTSEGPNAYPWGQAMVRIVALPPSVEEVIIKHFRHRGRVEVGFVPHLKVWAAEVELKPDDPRLKSWREGRFRTEPKEVIHFWNPGPTGHMEPLDLGAMGAEAVKQWLEERDVHSGRGKYKSLEEQVAAIDAENERKQMELRENAAEAGRARASLLRRTVAGNPLVAVHADLKAKE